ncbi:hypothetical protein M758_1G058000 [Ceratodon purpureus]|nr:hypothetical protein M758_1G058000 [Ceratodon purpureus]
MMRCLIVIKWQLIFSLSCRQCLTKFGALLESVTTRQPGGQVSWKPTSSALWECDESWSFVKLEGLVGTDRVSCVNVFSNALT